MDKTNSEITIFNTENWKLVVEADYFDPNVQLLHETCKQTIDIYSYCIADILEEINNHICKIE